MTRGCCRQEPAPTFDAQPPTEEKIEAIRCNQPTLPRFQVGTRGLTRSVVFAGTARQTAAKKAWPWPPFDEIYEVPITADTVGPDEHEPRPPLTPRKLAPIPPWCVSFQTAVFHSCCRALVHRRARTNTCPTYLCQGSVRAAFQLPATRRHRLRRRLELRPGTRGGACKPSLPSLFCYVSLWRDAYL